MEPMCDRQGRMAALLPRRATTTRQSISGQFASRSGRCRLRRDFQWPEFQRAIAPWQGESLETMHFVPDGPRRDLPQMGSRIMQSQLRRMTEAEQRDRAHHLLLLHRRHRAGRRGESSHAEAVALAARAWRLRRRAAPDAGQLSRRRTSRCRSSDDGALENRDR